MSPHAGWDIFIRDPGNPIITADDLPYRANSVFNPGAGLVDGETLLLIRVEDLRGISHLLAGAQRGRGDRLAVRCRSR